MALFGRMTEKSSSTRSLSAVNLEDDEQLVDWAEERWKNRLFYRQNLEKQWYLNIAFYLSYQWHSYDSTLQTLIAAPRRKGQVRLVCNKLQPGVRKFIAKAMRLKPTWTTIPATSDDEDVVKAQLSTKVLAYYWRYLDMDRQLIDFLLWLGTTGNAFIRAWWDPTKGPEMRFSPEELTSAGAEDFIGQAINMGDVQVSVRPPFAIDIDDGASDMQNLAFLIDSSNHGIERLKDRYGTKAEKIQPDSHSTDTLTQFYQRKIHDLTGGGLGFGGLGAGEEPDDMVIGHEVWINPTKKYPRGYYCFIAGGKVLERKAEIPNPKHRIPYYHTAQIPVPGRFWGTSAIEHAIPLQAAYNKSRSQIVQAQNLCAKPKVLEPKTARILDTAFTDESGERIVYTPPWKPEYMQLQPLPEYVHKNSESHLRDIEDVMTTHEVSNARAPSGVRSGIAINQLQEQDDQTLAPTFLLVERAMSALGSLILELVATNVTETRLVKIVGEDRSVDSFTFTGRNLIGPNEDMIGVNYFDVETQMGSQLPHSRAQRLQFTIDLVNSGILDRVADKKKIHQILELGSEEPALNMDQLDRNNARGEQKVMMQGYEVQVHPEDNPEIHLEEHIRWQKTAEFRRQAEADPMLRQRAEMHVMQHQGMLNAAMQQQMPAPAGEPEPMEVA